MFAVELLESSSVARDCYIVLNMPSVSHITWGITLEL